MDRFKVSALVIGVCLFFAVRVYGQRQKPAAERSRNAGSVVSTPVVSTPIEPDSPASDSTVTASAQASSQAASQAIVPRLIKFSGLLRDVMGKPLSGPLDVTFALYDKEAGGDPLWFETQSVQADELGHYTALLGAMHIEGLPVELFTSGEVRWLGIEVGHEQEQQPRVLLVSVPYALKAGDAETLGGKPASAYMLSDSQSAATSGAPGKGGVSTAGTVQGGGSGKKRTKNGAGPLAVSPCSSVTSDGSALANQIAFYTGACALGEDATFVHVGGNVGIGTSNPLLNVDLSGASSTNGVMIVRRGVQGADPNMVTTFGNPYLFIGGTEYKTNSIQSLGFGWSTNAGVLFHPPGEIGFQTTNINGYTSGDLVFATRNTLTNVAATEAMRITSAGNVGIGTINPAAPLSVNRAANQLLLQSNTPGGEASMAFVPGGSVHGWQTGVNANSLLPGLFVLENGGDYRLVIAEGGKVGIGTTAPAAKLDVAGDIKASGGLTAIGGGTFPGGLFSGTTLNVGTTLQVSAGSNVTVNGGFIVGATQTTLADAWTVRSSRRWKTNIRPLEGALEKVERLRGVTYDQKSDGKHQMGVIAEEVGKVVPEIVTYEKNGVDAQGVDYARFTALLIEATKEQQTLIRKQQDEINTQQARLEKQQEQITKLSSQVTIIQASLKAKRQSGSAVHVVKAHVAAAHSGAGQAISAATLSGR